MTSNTIITDTLMDHSPSKIVIVYPTIWCTPSFKYGTTMHTPVQTNSFLCSIGNFVSPSPAKNYANTATTLLNTASNAKSLNHDPTPKTHDITFQFLPRSLLPFVWTSYPYPLALMLTASRTTISSCVSIDSPDMLFPRPARNKVSPLNPSHDSSSGTVYS